MHPVASYADKSRGAHESQPKARSRQPIPGRPILVVQIVAPVVQRRVDDNYASRSCQLTARVATMPCEVVLPTRRIARSPESWEITPWVNGVLVQAKGLEF
ncbi:MAG TPA: hypothetical protein VF516_14965 [Kofleriaceae bacterium]